MWNKPPQALIDALQAAGLRRGYLVTDPQTQMLRASHAALEPLAAALAEHPDYFAHQGYFFEIGQESGHLLSACVHQTRRGQAAGGVRFWRYESVGELIRDGLRLARGMGQKNALAGLWWGGGKGVIARRDGVDHKNLTLREKVYRDYGRMMTGLRGCYVTAEDVGTTPPDMANIFATTRYTTCIPEAVGGSGNPSGLTASGVVVGMEAALEQLDLGSLEGKAVALQGLGNVSRFMARELLDRGVTRLLGADIDEAVVVGLVQELGDDRFQARVVGPSDSTILAEHVDIVAPNATGATLNPRTIPTIRAKIVCGAANNQLELAARDGAALRDQGVLYMPDFLCNRMGIVNCANEQYGAFDGDPAIQAHLERETPHGIFQRARSVFRRAEASGRCTAEEAQLLADELMEQPHPIWPDRGQQIIDALIASHWATV